MRAIAARAFVTVSQRELTATYNVCSGKAVRIESLTEHLRSSTRLDVVIVRDPERARPVDAPVLLGSAARLAEATGWHPRIPIERSIAALLNWWRAQLRAGEVQSDA